MRLNSIVLTSLLFPLILASPGDNLDEFIECNEACESRLCDPHKSLEYSNRFENFPFYEASPILKLLLWDCPSNCDYQCQQYITQLRVMHDEEVYQFHGKWPFKRLLFTQELASAFFSLLNFIPHYIHFYKAKQLYDNATTSSLRTLYYNVLIVSIVTQGAWIFSTIFHIRDLLLTERLDYFFAGATVLSGFHALVIRVFRFDLQPKKKVWVTRFCILLYLYHFIRLNYDWSYTYNMQANITIALLQYTLFLILAYGHYKRTPEKKSLYLTPIFLILSVLFGMSFEVFDFINLDYQIDAHAIWHLTTIIPSFWLYEFFYQDIESIKEKYID